MRGNIFLYFLLLLNCETFGQLAFKEDILKQGFESASIAMPDDYDGKVITTLIRKTKPGNQRAVLYVHGFSDYYFQVEMAEQYLAQGYDFYAVDLRKYGRSHLPHQRLFDVRNIHEYDADIDTALHSMKQAGYGKIILSGHSTGGLVIACYAHQRKGSELFDALVMNSPFLDMNQNWFTEHVVVPFGSFLGTMLPRTKAAGGVSPYYGYSIHHTYYGEWDFDTAWKPINIPPVNFGWVRAIRKAHKEVQKGNVVYKPCLVMHSDKSVYGKKWHTDFTKGDAVLDVQDIDMYGRTLGKEVKVVAIEDGLHDLVLSSPRARAKTYDELFSWLKLTLH
jgi:alpha-beta hydrolase superfamily lysophospholipase